MKIGVPRLAANLCAAVIRRIHRRRERLQALTLMREQDVCAMVWLVLEVKGRERWHLSFKEWCIARPNPKDNLVAYIPDDGVAHIVVDLGKVLMGQD